MGRLKVFIHNVFFLFFFVSLVASLFAIIYFFLDYYHLGPIVDLHSTAFHQAQLSDRFTRSLYFSFITLLSVGYGDVIPLGWSKGIAIIEAIIGYILPAVMVIRYVLFTPKDIKKLSSETNPVQYLTRRRDP